MELPILYGLLEAKQRRNKLQADAIAAKNLEKSVEESMK